MGKKVELVFDEFTLTADIFDTAVGKKFLEYLPLQIPLQEWGDELYGSLPWKISEENLVEEIPPGGLAYSPTGSLFCLFFGQKPAWPVEHFGQIEEENWKKLKETKPHNVLIRKIKEN